MSFGTRSWDDAGHKKRNSLAAKSGQSAMKRTSNITGAAVDYRDKEKYTVPDKEDTLEREHVETGILLFNQKPKKGIDYLLKHGVIQDDEAKYRHIADFLLKREELDKKMVGEILGKDNESAIRAASADSAFRFRKLLPHNVLLSCWIRMDSVIQGAVCTRSLVNTRYGSILQTSRLVH